MSISTERLQTMTEGHGQAEPASTETYEAIFDRAGIPADNRQPGNFFIEEVDGIRWPIPTEIRIENEDYMLLPSGATVSKEAKFSDFDSCKFGGRALVRKRVSVGSDVVCDPEVIIESDAVIGWGAKIGARSHIYENARVGNLAEIDTDIIIGKAARISTGAVVGCESRIGKNAEIGEEVKLGSRVQVGDHTRIYRAVIGSGSLLVGHLIIGMPNDRKIKTYEANTVFVNRRQKVVRR